MAGIANHANLDSPGGTKFFPPNDVKKSNYRMRQFNLPLSLALLLFQSVGRASLDVSIGHNFTGSQSGIDSSDTPSDTDGAIGPHHFVEIINGRYSVYDRTNESRVQTSTDLDFWKNAGVTFGAGLELTDPRVIFDRQANRWFASQIDFNSVNSGNRFLIAVSNTSDPTSGWTGFAFAADPINRRFADYPTLGVDANGVYLGANLFNPGTTGTFVGVTLVAIPKADLLKANPTIANRTSFGTMTQSARGFVLQPVVSFDSTAGVESVISVPNDGASFTAQTILKRFSVQNAAGPGSATLSATANISVGAYLIPINPPQPDASADLDDGDLRIGSSCYQVGNVIYAVHSVNVGTSAKPLAALRWYKLNAADNTLIQVGIISNSSFHYIYPSIAANSNGVVVIGFNGCGTNSFVSSYAVVGETIAGVTTFGTPLLLKSGTASYNDPGLDGTSRWGDYSATSPDPTDPNRFWTIQSYATGAAAWSTQITEIIAQPSSPPRLSIILNGGDSVVVAWPSISAGYTLLFSTDLSMTNWTPVAEVPGIVNGFFSVTNNLAGGARFYRLQK